MLGVNAAAWWAVAGNSAAVGLLVARFSGDDSVGFTAGLSGLVLGGFLLILRDIANLSQQGSVTAPRQEVPSPRARGEDGSGPPERLSRHARRLSDYYARQYHDVRQAIDEGLLALTEARDIRKMLLELSEGAHDEILAVDHIDIENWYRIDLKHYLHCQLNRARRGVRVQRIRLFDPAELVDAYRRELLRAFLRMHEDAGADLVLCPMSEELREKFRNSMFFPRTGCLIVDKDDDLCSLRGAVGDGGFIETAEVSLGSDQPARSCVKDYQALLNEIKRSKLHEQVLRVLDEDDDDTGSLDI